MLGYYQKVYKMKFAGILLAIALLAGCDAQTQVLSYEQLTNYPVQCSKADDQLKQLRAIQRIKNFNPDPELLSAEDYLYNSRLKATIWWYAYECDKS
jgi:hypothetical protein